MRNTDFAPNMKGRVPAAAAGAQTIYFPVVAPFVFEGFAWNYESTEANADNTLDFVIAADTELDGTFDGTTLHTNANAVGLLNSTPVGKWEINTGDAASGGGAAVAVTPTPVRLAEGADIVATLTTAGTGTIPAIGFAILGHYVQPGSWVQAVDTND